MFTSATINMVNSKKFVTIFTAAYAFATVVGDSFHSGFASASLRPFISQVFVGNVEFLASCMLFLGVGVIATFGVFKKFLTVFPVVFITASPLIFLFTWFASTMQTIFTPFAALEVFKSSWENPFAL